MLTADLRERVGEAVVIISITQVECNTELGRGKGTGRSGPAAYFSAAQTTLEEEFVADG